MPHTRHIAALAAVLILVGACSGNPTQTTESAGCQNDAMWIVNEGQRIDLMTESIGKDLGVGDLDAAHDTYRQLLSVIEWYEYRSNQFAAECADAEGRSEIQTAMANMETGVAMMREFCDQNLAPHGFDC